MEDIGSKVHFLAKKGFLGTKTPLGGQKNFLTKIFLVVIEVVWRPNQKKISNGLGCRTGTDERTHARERIYRFPFGQVRGTKK